MYCIFVKLYKTKMYNGMSLGHYTQCNKYPKHVDMLMYYKSLYI